MIAIIVTLLSITGVIDWITNHWLVIVAVVSEIMAFFPKYNGIVQAIIKIGNIIFKKTQ